MIRTRLAIWLRKRDARRSYGRPSTCMFCTDRPTYVVYDGTNQAFLCKEDIGPFLNDWVNIHDEISVVRL